MYSQSNEFHMMCISEMSINTRLLVSSFIATLMAVNDVQYKAYVEKQQKGRTFELTYSLILYDFLYRIENQYTQHTLILSYHHTLLNRSIAHNIKIEWEIGNTTF